jgi:hypothetical protein
LRRSERNLGSVDLAGIEEPPDMFGEAKYFGSALGLVAANSFKPLRTIVEGVGHHVHCRLVPIDELAVKPDLFGFHGSKE